MQNFAWQANSYVECELAEKITSELLKKKLSLEEYSNIISNIEQYTLNYDIEFTKPFPDSDKCISNNIISQIAYLLSEQLSKNDGKGVVLTPNILAEDMVKMSIIEWIYCNTSISRITVANYIYGKEEINFYDKKTIKDHLSSLVWYDPCVGGGVFPLAIIKIYREMEIDAAPVIYGNDLNPLYVAATIKRMKLSLVAEDSLTLNKRIVCRDALDNNLPQINLFGPDKYNQQYDIVIGNPPYVKSGSIDKTAKKKYETNYPKLSHKGTDLYTYFINHGINALKDSGILTFVTPAQFQMSNYGKAIRTVIEENGDVCAIADFNELPVFKNIGIHTSVYSIVKSKKCRDFIRYEYDVLPKSSPFEKLYYEGTLFPQNNISAKGWFFSSLDAYKILNHLESIGTPLIEYSDGVFSGIKSSCKTAFFVKGKDIIGFNKNEQHKCRKILLPKKIKRWRSIWEDDFMIIIKKDEILDESSQIYAHMKKHQEELTARSDVAGHKTWYGLRQCVYYEKFDRPKIIYPDIATECRFSLDRDSLFIPDGAFFIPGENYYLLGILNSCIGQYYFKQKCARIGNPKKGGRIRFKKVYIENFPIVPENHNWEIANKIQRIAMCAVEKGYLTEEQEIMLNEYAMQMYELPIDMKASVTEARNVI